MFRGAKTAKPVAWQIADMTVDSVVISNICLQADSEKICGALVNVNWYFYFSYQPMRITKKLLELVRESKKDRVMQMLPLRPECLFAKYGDDKSPFHAAMTIGDTDLLESMEPYIYLVPGAAETTLKQINRLLDEIHAFVPYDFNHVVNVISNAKYEENTIDPESKRELEKLRVHIISEFSDAPRPLCRPGI